MRAEVCRRAASPCILASSPLCTAIAGDEAPTARHSPPLRRCPRLGRKEGLPWTCTTPAAAVAIAAPTPSASALVPRRVALLPLLQQPRSLQLQLEQSRTATLLWTLAGGAASAGPSTPCDDTAPQLPWPALASFNLVRSHLTRFADLLQWGPEKGFPTRNAGGRVERVDAKAAWRPTDDSCWPWGGAAKAVTSTLLAQLRTTGFFPGGSTTRIASAPKV